MLVANDASYNPEGTPPDLFVARHVLNLCSVYSDSFHIYSSLPYIPYLLSCVLVRYPALVRVLIALLTLVIGASGSARCITCDGEYALSLDLSWNSSITLRF